MLASLTRRFASPAAQFHLRAAMSTIVGKSLVFSAPGVPTEVLRLEERTLPGPHDLESGQILVKMLVVRGSLGFSGHCEIGAFLPVPPGP